jgi:MarR family transcriptional regulator, organic hydroperoxide resistance regulator
MGMSDAQPSGETLQFMQFLWALVHALDVRSKRMVKTVGVTGPQRLVIRIVGQKPHRTASEIAAILGMHPSTLTGLLARLEARDMLAREADPDDRRRARVSLTAAGRKIDKLQRGTVEAAVRRALGRVNSTSLDSTRATLSRLIEELERDD